VSWHLDKGETPRDPRRVRFRQERERADDHGHLETRPRASPAGEIRFNGTDLLTLPAEAQRAIRGAQISMVFQDALSALNPVFTVGSQIAEMFRVHRGTSKKEALDKAAELMDRVRIPGPQDRVKDYPHQFSGGMRQRVMIAMALALDPDVLIADEPTTALDVTVQAQIVDLLLDLQRGERDGASCSSPTTSAWWPRPPTASPSCTRAASWRPARSTRCSRTPRTPTPPG
jgi:energy-coupling factor transporter ATP-binding protein EcfA2